MSDLDAALSELGAGGLSVDTVEEFGEGARKATLLDADGNTVAIIEVGG